MHPLQSQTNYLPARGGRCVRLVEARLRPTFSSFPEYEKPPPFAKGGSFVADQQRAFSR